MGFVIDEISWTFDGLDSEQCIEVLESILDCIDDAMGKGHNCCYSDDLFHMPIREGHSFYELYEINTPLLIPQEIRERVAVAFGRLQSWQDMESPWPNDFYIVVDGGANEYAPSIAWAHAQTSADHACAVACITHPFRWRSGCREVDVSGEKTPIWFVNTERDREYYFRWMITETAKTPAEMEILAVSAFRSLDFAEGVFKGIKSMSKPFVAIAPAIVTHLSVLSDEGKRIFSGPRERVSAEFGALGINISDENGNTKKNTRARAERTIVFNHEELQCWWHTKIEPHQDRIHIYPEKLRTGGRLIVGIFCDHLTT